MKKFLILIVAISLYTGFNINAETLDTIKAVEEASLMNNIEYKTALLDVLKTENDLKTTVKLSNSSISLSGGYTPLEDFSSSIDWSAAATLPIIEQISLEGKINKNLEPTISVSINPLSHSAEVESSRLNYQQKIAAAKQKADEISLAAIESYLNWASLKAEYEIKRKIADVKKILYEDEKIRLEQGESTLDDVRTAFTAWSNTRASLNSSISFLASAETELYSILNIDSGGVKFVPPELDAIIENIELLTKTINLENLSESGSYSILSAELNKQAIGLTLDKTWLLEPDFNINASLVFPANEESPKFSASAVCKIALDNWNSKKLVELKKEYEISKEYYNQTIRTERLKLEQAITASENAAINYDIAVVGTEQSKELLDEANFLFKKGDYSAASRDETELEYETSKNLLFTAASNRLLSLKTLETYSDKIK